MDCGEKRVRQEVLVLCAFRYCIGRRTAVVSEMVEHLLGNWSELSEHFRFLILSEISWSVEHGLCGDPCDIREWRKITDAFGTKEEL